MKKILRRLPSPAMVVACIALAVALGGTSYAAIKLPRNSVGTNQLQKNAVVASKLSARSVGPQKLQNNAVTERTVKDGQLTGAKIVESTLAKVPSAANADTAANATLAGGNTVKRFTTVVAPGGAEATVLSLNGLTITLACPGGSVALRGNNSAGEAAQLEFQGFGEGRGPLRRRREPRGDDECESQQRREPRHRLGAVSARQRNGCLGVLRLAGGCPRRSDRVPCLRRSNFRHRRTPLS